MSGALLRLVLGAGLVLRAELVLGAAVALPPGCCKTKDWMLHVTCPLRTVEVTPLAWKEV
jgi:hypothetical protein